VTTNARLIVLFGLLLTTASTAWGQSASPVSPWGAQDEIGAANYLNPAKVLAAAKLVRSGRTYALGIETNSRTPSLPHRSFGVFVTQPGQTAGATLGPSKTTYNDDLINGWMGVGSQIDGLGHIGVDHVYYNGLHARDFVETTGLKKLGVEKIPPIVTRGVLLDMAGFLGAEMVTEGVVFNRPEIEGAAKRQGVEIGRGDVVLFHTGWLKLMGQDDKRFLAGEPGLGREGAKYLVEKGVVAIGADTWGLEAIPFEKDAGVFEVHQILIPKAGIYILENMNTAPLAADKAYEFLFVLGQPKITGAVQAIVNPVAIR
jgi:kynurenine formamidase